MSAGVPEPPGPPELDLLAAARDLLGAEVRRAEGGFSGETFLVGAPGEDAVLRLYRERPERAAVDAALIGLVRGLVPVPGVLETRTPQASGAPSLLLTERVPGVRLELVLEGAEGAAPPPVRERAGAELGAILARLAGIPFPRGGSFAGPDLAVQPWPEPDAGLPDWVRAHAGADGFAGWLGALWEDLLAVAERAQRVLESASAAVDSGVDRACLVHGDVNPKNVLVDPETGRVTALIDWEFAHAGLVETDLGNLLRFESDPVFCRAAVGAYLDRVPGSPPADRVQRADRHQIDRHRIDRQQVDQHRIARARAMDLLALVDLAARADGPRANPVARRARTLLIRIARERDLAAGRPSWLARSPGA